MDSRTLVMGHQYFPNLLKLMDYGLRCQIAPKAPKSIDPTTRTADITWYCLRRYACFDFLCSGILEFRMLAKR